MGPKLRLLAGSIPPFTDSCVRSAGLVTLLAAALAMGCSASDDAVPGDGGSGPGQRARDGRGAAGDSAETDPLSGELSPEGCARRAQLRCETTYRCGFELSLEGCLARLKPQCKAVQSYQETYHDKAEPALIAKLEAANRLCYARAAARGCEAHRRLVRPFDCPEFTELFAEISPAPARPEQREPGQSCLQQSDCRRGVCLALDTCPGTCTVHKTDAPCRTDGHCGDGERCLRDSPDMLGPGRCRPEVGEGQSCAHNHCQRPFVCLEQDGGEKRCGLQGVKGESCRDHAGCASPWFCREGSCGPLPAGACRASAHCSTGQRCDLSRSEGPVGQCIDRQVADEPCDRSRSDSCADGLFCKAGEGTRDCLAGDDDPKCRTYSCAPRVQAGQPCQSANACASKLWCDSETGRCAVRPPRLALGEPCKKGLSCSVGICVSTQPGGQTRCAEQVGPGQPCVPENNSRDCKSDLFCSAPGRDGPYRCMPRIPAGQPCNSDTGSFCQSGYTCHPRPNGHCILRAGRALGQTCSTAERCSGEGYCREGICVPREKAGKPCQFGSSASECAPDLTCATDRCTRNCWT